MPVPLVGELALWIALLLALWGVVVSTLGRALHRPELVSSAARALHALGSLLALALAALATSLARLDLSLAYVAAHAGANATRLELIGALWSGSAGALLLVGVVTATAASLAAASVARVAPPRDVATTVATAHLALLGLVVTVVLGAPPFEGLPWLPADGRGLPPLQRHTAALILPPIWAMAIAAAATTFAIATAAALGRIDRPVLAGLAMRWALRAWVLVTASLVAALWWSYETTGTPGIWTARVVGPVPLGAWIGLTGAVHLANAAGAAGPGRLRFAVLGLPLLLLLASALVRAEGTWDPLHELAHGRGAVWWVVMVAALTQVFLYVLWRTPGIATPIHARPGNTRALGSRLASAGGLLLLAGLAAGLVRRDHVVELRPGAATEVTGPLGRNWRVTFQGTSMREVRGPGGLPRWREMLVPLAMSEAGVESHLVIAGVREYLDALGRTTSPPWPQPAIRRGIARDMIVVPEELVDGEAVRMRISFVPLPGLIWIGGIALVVGAGLIAAGSRP
ncbi:MAG TPA: cytochrome c-type biogenesis CcmF C-terminal domain-containing protein [Gemmatimonadaceae bacterium]|nr:cytochrome c-type biogenesis CcmF C-terminal domain-containing protein [Gemmatimonadaceae bacterium]